MADQSEHEKTSAAIVEFLRDGWSRETERRIVEAYGDEIATKVHAAYDQAMDCPVDWHSVNMNEALGVLSAYMRDEMSWLSPEARTWLNYCYIMVWR